MVRKSRLQRSVSRSQPSVSPPPLAMLQSSETEETFKRLSAHKGVEGIVVVNKEGTQRERERGEKTLRQRQ